MDTESVASIRRANGALFFGATKALMSWDSSSSAADPSTKGPKDQPMETTVSVEDESTPAEGDERQPTAETCHTAEEGPETEALLDPENVTLTEVDQDSVPTGSSQETGSQDVTGNPGNSYAEDSRYRNPRATRWNLCEEELKERLGIMPTSYGSEAEMETFANCLNSAILSSYEASSPLKKVDKAGLTEDQYKIFAAKNSKENWMCEKCKQRVEVNSSGSDYDSADDGPAKGNSKNKKKKGRRTLKTVDVDATLNRENPSRNKNLVFFGANGEEDVEKILENLNVLSQPGDYTVKIIPTKSINEPVIVTFKQVELRNKVIERRKAKKVLDTTECKIGGPMRKIYINEDVPRETRALFNKAKKLKTEKDFKFVWIKNGQVYCCESEDARAIRIVNPLQIEEPSWEKLGT
ncbi:hypothetical protein JTB14_020608 [Gonioctena quinquepunctata]|nr:hypothetical protein JTB14_020608 [Gonioctena quinquepunctata]